MKKSYRIIGMHCAGCAGRLESKFAVIPELQNAAVSILTNQLAVEFDSDVYSPEFIDSLVAENVEKAGFQLEANSTSAPKAPESVPINAESVESTQKRTADSAFINIMVKLYRSGLFWSVASLIALMYFSMGAMLGLPLPAWASDPRVSGWIQAHLLIPILFFNRSFFVQGGKSLLRLTPNMDALIALGAGVSILYSLIILTLLIYEPQEIGHISSHFYFESAAMILTIVSLGRYLESQAKRKTTAAIEALINLAPPRAHVVRNGEESEILASEVQINDTVIVKPGESVPVDGIVLEGSTDVDQSALTGESALISIIPGDEMSAGTINGAGRVVLQALRVGQDTTLSQIVRLMESAASGKAPISRLADKVCAVFVPLVLLLSLITFLGWMAAGESINFALNCAVSVLVISCPCALGLATPTAIMVGTGKAAKMGILFNSALALESLNKVDTVVFDKTGTITLGKPSVSALFPWGISEDELLSAAASLESGSEHPLARAIIDKAVERNSIRLGLSDFQAIPGWGVRGRLDNIPWIAGNKRFLEENGIELPPSALDLARQCGEQGATPLWFAQNGRFRGIVAVADTIKPGAADAIARLIQRGKRVILLTGDNRLSAVAMARLAGISEVIADVAPDKKAEVILNLQQSGRKTAMVGDGINDAVALTAADVGIALGTGTDIAMESADVILQRGDVQGVPDAMELSQAVVTNIKENLFWAFLYNIIGIPLAMGLFYPAFGWTLSPMYAAGAMSLSSICVVLNALRLSYFKKRS